MAQIAEAVGLEVSSIYYYFASKHEVLERIVVDVNRIPLAIAAEVRQQFDDPARQLHAFVRRDAAALCDFPFDFNEIHRLARDDRDGFARYWSDRDALLAEVGQFIDRGIADGVLQAADAELAALTILANDEAVQNWYRPSTTPIASRLTPDVIGTFVADLALRGLLVDIGQLGPIGRDTAVFDG